MMNIVYKDNVSDVYLRWHGQLKSMENERQV